MIALEGVPAEKVLVEPNAYVPRPGRVRPATLRAELGLAAEVPLVGTAATTAPAEGAARCCSTRSRGCTRRAPHLVIAGDGPRRAALERRADALGVAGRTHFLGAAR